MLTWDEEIKPTSPLHYSCDASSSRSASPAQRAGAPLIHENNLLDELVATAQAWRRVNAADKCIINNQTNVNHKMTGASEQCQYSLRDESGRCNFDIDLINPLQFEYPPLWTGEFKTRIRVLFEESAELEYRYEQDSVPRGVLGTNATMFKGYLRYIAIRRATQIDLEIRFANEENHFPWMSEMIDLKKEQNFFESRVIEYPSGGTLSWD